MNKDLTAAQQDYAVFTPAISSFFATYIGKQQSDPQYVPTSRMPANIPEMEMLNFLNDQEGIFKYRWGLYSAGHANLDLTKEVPKEDMIRKRGPHTLMLADSGGFQIGKGVWEGDWTNPNDKNTEKRRSTVLKWLCQISDYSMTLDIPTWTAKNPEAAAKVGVKSISDAFAATEYNNDYFIRNRFGDAKFLNVMQGSNHKDAEEWYLAMKDFCDPKKYERHFNGWGMGGANMADPHLALKRIVTLIKDGLLEQGVHDWMHFLGTSKLEWAVLLTEIQRAVRRTHNPNFTISFDCASPFLATANGQLYTHTRISDHKKWSYQMEATADNKAYATDTRLFRDAVMQDKIHPIFDDSPISEKMQISDVCVYAPGDLNKIGKEGKTSWDSFSYALLMSHNVWHHINAVQEANRHSDRGEIPTMFINEHDGHTIYDVINEVFDEPDYDNRLALLEKHSKFLMRVDGARGFGGKKAQNASAEFSNHFENFEEIKTIKSKDVTPKADPATIADTNLFEF